MFQPEFLAALAMGFVGSLHCIGMCGPIALIAPSAFPGSMGRFVGMILYNGGRIVTYAALGFIVGSIGKGLAFFKWQQGLSIAIGTVIIISALIPGMISKGKIAGFGLSFTGKIKEWMGKYLRKTSAGGILGIGLVNGLLPCGLVYLGLAGSLDMSESTLGAIFMVYFGLGTFPMMAGMYLAGNSLRGSWRNKLVRVIPFFLVVMGLLFILRGLGLGIPYVSPSMDPHTGDIHCTSPAHRHQ